MKKRYLLLFVVVIALLALAAPALAYSTGFETFAGGTAAASLTVPGMSFSGATWSTFNYGITYAPPMSPIIRCRAATAAAV